MSWLAVIILSIIEGITEYLPVSSTGHMILASSIMGIHDETFVQHFEIIIQFGAILSVLVLYWERFRKWNPIYKKIFIAFLPTAIIGFILKNKVEALLSSPYVVAYALIAGGIVFIALDKWFQDSQLTKTHEDLSTLNCVQLGLFQTMALIPGVSRSGATIIGALFLKMTRKEAAEFSFFLAVPTLAAASLYKTAKIINEIQSEQISQLLVGALISFVVAMIAIRFFISLVSKYGFALFGWYRIVLGVTVLIFLYSSNH